MGKFIFQMDRHREEFRKRKVNISICMWISIGNHMKGMLLFEFGSKQFDELFLKVHIIVVLVDESYFGNKKSKIQFIFVIFPIPIKCN